MTRQDQPPTRPAELDAWAAIDAALEPILITDAQLDAPGPRIVHANPAFERLTGWRLHELIGQTPRILQGPETDLSIFAPLRETMARGESWHGLTKNYRRDGSTYWLEWSINPIPDGRGRTKWMIAIQRDVTARIVLQAMLDQALRTVAEANQTKADFIAMMTHELRLPLNAILGYAELIASGEDLKGRTAQFGKVILESGTQLLSTIDEILDYSRSASGRLPLFFVQADLRFLVGGCIELLAPVAQANGTTIRLVPGEAVLARFDETRIRQVLTNLLGNAINHGRVGGSVDVRVDATDAVAVVEVADDGPGIPADIGDRVFEPFFQITDATERRHRGSGLGLAIVRRFAELHDGTATHFPNPAGGTTFRLTLPTGGG